MSSLLSLPFDSSEKVRVVFFIEDISFVYNYGKEITWREFLRLTDAKKAEIRSFQGDVGSKRQDAAFRFLSHVRSVFTKSGKMKHRFGYTNQTDTYLTKHIHFITGMSLKYIIKDENSQLAFLTGDVDAKLSLYETNPDAKEMDIHLTKERVFDSLLLLIAFNRVDKEEYTIQVFPEKHFAQLDSVSFCCNLQCDTRWEKSSKKQMVCSRCRTASYCSKKCQKSDWVTGGHKESCDSIIEGKQKAKALNIAMESIRGTRKGGGGVGGSGGEEYLIVDHKN